MALRCRSHFAITADTSSSARVTAVLATCCLVLLGSTGASAEDASASSAAEPQEVEVSPDGQEVTTKNAEAPAVVDDSKSIAGETDSADENPDGSAPSDAERTQKSMNDVLGTTAESDYVAKHFSFVFGGVVLNQFKVQRVPSTMPGWPDQFYLDSGNSDAKAYLELGFRWRWAWLDRDSYLESQSQDSKYQSQRLKLEQAIARRRAAQAVSDAKLQVLAAATLSGGDAAALTLAVNESVSAQRALDSARVDELIARSEFTTSVTEGAQDRSNHYGSREKYFSLRDRWKTKGGGFFIPDDWSVRLGFVFDGSTSANDVVATVGASDLYGELGLGWNLVKWSFATRSIAKEPIRATINLEANATFFTDENINDVHGRGIIGAAFVFGLPVKYAGAQKLDAFDPSRIENESVIELLARFGAVVAEIPDFTGVYTNELQSEFNQVSYSSQVGIGLDVEFNVPINERLGYVFARGQINALFDPNPWFISLGYTIPLSTITSAITSSASN